MKYYYNIEKLFKDINNLENETIMVCYDFGKNLNDIGMPEYKYLRRKIKENNIKIIQEPKGKSELFKIKVFLEEYNKEKNNGYKKTI